MARVQRIGMRGSIGNAHFGFRLVQTSFTRLAQSTCRPNMYDTFGTLRWRRFTVTAAFADYTRNSPSSTYRRAPRTTISAFSRQTFEVSSLVIGMVMNAHRRVNGYSEAQAKRRFVSSAITTPALGMARRMSRGRSRPSNLLTVPAENSLLHIPTRSIRCGSSSRLSRCFAARAAQSFAKDFLSLENSS
jgi:hypothetical protein